MTFHPNKCKILSVNTRRSTIILSELPFFQFYYSLNGVMIDYVTQHMDLGVIITSDLSWSSHCEYIAKSMTSKFNLIRRTCYFLNKSPLKRSLYLSMVRSLVEHCNSVWCSIGKTQLVSLERIQKRAVKWIRNEPLASYSNDQYVSHLNELNLLPFKEMFEYSDLRLFYKIVNDLTPIAIPTCFSRVDAQSLRYTRQNEAITLGLDQTSYKDNTRWNIQSVIHDSIG